MLHNLIARPLRWIVVLLFCIAACSSRPPRKEVIEPEAVEVIDFDKLENPLAEIIEAAKSRKLVGQDASKFSSVLNASNLRRIENQITTSDEYVIRLPERPEAYDSLNGQFKMCWPACFIEVDRATHKIVMCRIYIQCL